MTAKTLSKRPEAASAGTVFPPLETVTTPFVDTQQAAHYLLRKPGTLRIWACNETGLVHPKRVGRRLFWPVAGIRAALGMGDVMEG
ncbi:hypothetical protein DJFAAGMI_04422 [Comamonas sp. PE63]|uniref:DNA-binding protein n=1 Tax=Comamonas brasiliensis TaxID=1812482 RepID=A0ABS5LYP4_9BURK|nr:hypothetical protein [Comamonas sp. PE63]MBS3021648.1 hypothetical protein [Comamonas sp. PE63]